MKRIRQLYKNLPNFALTWFLAHILAFILLDGMPQTWVWTRTCNCYCWSILDRTFVSSANLWCSLYWSPALIIEAHRHGAARIGAFYLKLSQARFTLQRLNIIPITTRISSDDIMNPSNTNADSTQRLAWTSIFQTLKSSPASVLHWWVDDCQYQIWQLACGNTFFQFLVVSQSPRNSL